ncbi:BA75_04516T0 [Komagataella pastoris]|uniref:holo-[acyl-carrier-protein] synthase n=1 Tax=Komagataella pastoris TaxID=4922 RepID=A0A1B2JJ33_PICPA|nr:BA75_04516T0 [Komagataella pastoris]
MDDVFQRWKQLTQRERNVFVVVKVGNELEDDYLMELCLRQLSLKQRNKILARKNRHDQRMALLGGLLLRAILSLEYEMDILFEPEITVAPCGKPSIEQLEYNMADDESVIGLVFRRKDDALQLGNVLEKLPTKPLGIDLADIQTIKQFQEDPLQLLRSFSDIFHPNETKVLERELPRHTEEKQFEILTQYWALKESCSKYHGVGLHQPLHQWVYRDISVLQIEKSLKEDEMEAGLSRIHLRKLDLDWNYYHGTEPAYVCKLTSRIIASVIADAKPIVVQMSEQLIIDYAKRNSK